MTALNAANPNGRSDHAMRPDDDTRQVASPVMKESREFVLMCVTGVVFVALIGIGTASDLSAPTRLVAWVLVAPAAVAQGIAIRNYRRFAKRYHAENQERFEQRLREQAADHRRSLDENS